MKYGLFIYEDEALYGPDKANETMRQIVAQHRDFSQSLGPKRIGGAGLKGTATATTVRNSGGRKTVHDGPFAEAREQLGGFYLIEADDLDEAVDVAKRVPLLDGGAIEVRPLLGA